MPVHHLDTFAERSSNQEFWDKLDSRICPDDALEQQMQYADAMKKARDAAAHRIPATWVWASLEDRASQRSREARRMTPWAQAQIDCYDAISSGQATGSSDEHRLADISQSANRGSVHHTGCLPTLTCGTCIWSFKRQKRLTPSVLMACHGFAKYKFEGCTFAECTRAVGNIMCATSLSLVLIPVLHGIRFLKKQE